MMDVLLVRLKADLMALPTQIIDKNDAGTQPAGHWPTRSMFVGLVGNCHGVQDHRPEDRKLLDDLQENLIYAVARLQDGVVTTDYQTADFSLHSRGGKYEALWSPYGWIGKDRGAKTYEKRRPYHSGCEFLMAVASPHADLIKSAFRYSKRIPYLGANACFLTEPLFPRTLQADSLVEALESQLTKPTPCRWPVQGPERSGRKIRVVEDKDWTNSVLVGCRLLMEGTLQPSERHDAAGSLSS